MFIKVGNANHTATKFAANILYIIGSMCKIGLFSKKLQSYNKK